MDPDGGNVTRVTITDSVVGEQRGSWVPAWAPDGSRIVFASNRDDGGAANLYSVSPDGSNLRRLTNHKEFDYTPDFSPDGSKIAFMSNRDGFGEIYIMNADGSGVRRLTHLEKDEGRLCCPDWSPDGVRLAFNAALGESDPPPVAEEAGSPPPPSRMAVHVINADGSGLHAIRYGGLPRWSPDGDWIAFVKRAQVHVMRDDGSDVRQITDMEDGRAVYPGWSPKGDRIAFTFIGPGEDVSGTDILLIDVDGSNVVNLTDNERIFDAHSNWW